MNNFDYDLFIVDDVQYLLTIHWSKILNKGDVARGYIAGLGQSLLDGRQISGVFHNRSFWADILRLVIELADSSKKALKTDPNLRRLIRRRTTAPKSRCSGK